MQKIDWTLIHRQGDFSLSYKYRQSFKMVEKGPKKVPQSAGEGVQLLFGRCPNERGLFIMGHPYYVNIESHNLIWTTGLFFAVIDQQPSHHVTPDFLCVTLKIENEKITLYVNKYSM